MNLVIDQGNTICKIAVFKENDLLEVLSVATPTREDLQDVVGRFPSLEGAIYSSVGAREDETPLHLGELFAEPVVVGSDTRVPLEVLYDREALGSDRLAAAVGAYYLAGGAREILVIDAGTAITYERITASGVYLGGNISPGLHIRFKAMHQFTSRLPLVDDVPLSRGFGTTTVDAMAKGVLEGLCYEVGGYIEELRSQHSDAVVYLTGGDAPEIAAGIKQDIEIVPDLVLYGLNQILEYKNRC